MLRSTLLVLAILFGIFQINRAQEIEFSARAPKVVRAGEQFQLVYTTNRDLDEFTAPGFGDFRYLGGPGTSSGNARGCNTTGE